jgi:hypothetical protein
VVVVVVVVWWWWRPRRRAWRDRTEEAGVGARTGARRTHSGAMESSGSDTSRDEMPPTLARASSIGSGASCRPDEEEASIMEASPATTPPRPCLPAGAVEEGEGNDTLSMFRQLYDHFFQDEDKKDDDEEEQERGRRRLRVGATTAVAAAAEAEASQTKRPRGSAPGLGADTDKGLSALPGECLREVASFLPASDLWPAFTLVSKRVSCRPAVLPLLMAACPRTRLPGVLFGLWATTATATDASSGPSSTDGERHPEVAAAPCRNLRVLDLSCLPLGEVGARRLAGAFGHGGLPALRSLDLASSGLAGAAFESLACALSQQRPAAAAAGLQSLCLSGNGIGDRGVGSLGRALQHGACPRLQVKRRRRRSIQINCQPTMPPTHRANPIPHTHPHTQVLELAGTGLTEAGTDALAHVVALGRCSQLRRLDLSGNPSLGAAGAALLVAGLRDGGGGGSHALEVRG